MSHEPVRVLVAEGWGLLRSAMSEALSEEPDLEVVSQAADDEEALEQAARHRPDVAVVDVGLPRRGGAAVCAAMKAREVAGAVIVLADTPDESLLVASVEADADGFVPRTVGLDELVGAIRCVHAREACIPPGMLSVLLRRLIDRRRGEESAVRQFARLSRRERDVLVLVAEGLDNQAIADRLVVSPNTARTHVQHLLKKLRVHSRLEAAALAAEHRLIERFASQEGAGR